MQLLTLLVLLVSQNGLSKVATWELSMFSAPKQATIGSVSIYSKSPKEADLEVLRTRRQAYQVYQDGDSSVTVDKSGQAESGAWGEWSRDQECSRTCDGGVQIEKRECSGDCNGPSTRYVSCNIEACPSDSDDFRAEQCSKYDDTPMDGKYYKWLPFPGKNKCELTCKPDNANFYYKWADKVIDGTKCDQRSKDICVEGVCLPVGCDNKLGSAKKDDKCGVCSGNSSTCKTIEGFFSERSLSPGYHNIIRLPVGTTSIRIEEMRPTTNSLAIKNASDHFYLNGNNKIELTDKDIEIGGTLFEYDTRKNRDFEKLTAKGPTNEELVIALLFQRGNRETAIKYEFSVPLKQDIPYVYKPGDWSGCSVTCGKGAQQRTAYCIESETRERVNDELCEQNNVTKPPDSKDCETVHCEAEWFTGDWESCSATCGDSGTQYRVVYCHQIFADGKRITVSDDNCTAERPTVQQTCNRFACPEWQAGPWSACSEKCGDAFQYRSVTCRSEKEGEEGKLLAADACGEHDLDVQRNCNLGPCEGLNFVTTDWLLCEKCNDTEETRNVTCKDKTGRIYPLEKCLNNNSTEIPTDTRPCATSQPCIYEWHTSEWLKCSTECGHGHQSRRVVCAIHQLGDLTIVDESHCDNEAKPENTMNCTNEEKCNGTYYSGPWDTCSAECDGGTQKRMLVCLNYDKKPVPEWCDEAEKPAEEQECNTDPCPTCDTSEFGCCPDNVTFASGAYLEGCSNCSSSTFGCCADNVTEATGKNSKGCLEFVEMPEGSGEDFESMSDDEAPEDKECVVANEETGENATISCVSANATIDELIEMLSNGTDQNDTMHCAKSKFGCCSDWTTEATGKNNEGCSEFVLGNCNDTANGCCLDEVTMARGPNYEGCGEPTCAASLYGCCKDRKTIAFGPHYAGCERSSFPCELSAFGCCPDGETAALDKNGTGCGANCLVTKYGCCPDGVTMAKGYHNNGCGCEYAQFGCCPDGKNTAEGPNNHGCPESCAQSRHGCCPDGKTMARGPNKEGCPCQYTRYGCCPDGETTALGPRNDGCDDCRYAKYGCCPDGETRAVGSNYAGCLLTTVAPFLFGGTVAPEKIVSCSLPQDQGTVCHPGYKLSWYYDGVEGRCSQFWYGGCEGNDNRFATEEQCDTTCVKPPTTGRCFLPKIEGPMRCNQLSARYWYDYTTKQCGAFWWRGCMGNANNFESWEECQNFCSGIGPIERKTTPPSEDAETRHLMQPDQHQPSREDSDESSSEQHPDDQKQTLYIPVEPQSQLMPKKQPPTDQMPQSILQNVPQESAASAPMTGNNEMCRATANSGPCGNYEDMFYFDAFSGKCHPFIYGGCGGNPNKFRTKQECEEQCAHMGPDHYAKSRDACNERMDVGRCKGNFESFYFEKATGTCEAFRYSGCGGNSNRFHSKEQCMQICVGVDAQASSANAEQPLQQNQPTFIADNEVNTGSVCEEARDTGPCNRFVTKWYYNRADGTCSRFHYGGCGGTENRFDSEQLCKNECADYADACKLPKVVGPCSGRHPRFYYNAASRRCDEFEYGGCLGNSNNFVTQHDCQTKCSDASE